MSLLAYQEQLILLVKENPPIYDKKDHRYKERGPGGVVSNIWEAIYQQLRLSYPTFVTDADNVKTQWGKLRESYMSAMRRRKESQRSGAGAGIQEPWRLERQMKWIDDFAHLRQASTNLPSNSTNMPAQHINTGEPNIRPMSPSSTASLSSDTGTTSITDTIPSRPERPESAPTPLTTTQGTMSDRPSGHIFTSPQPTTRGRKRAATSPAPSVDPVEQGILDQLTSLTSALQKPARDESDNIGTMVACQHRTLTFEQRAIFLHGIQEAYMKALEHSYREEDDRVYRDL